MVEHNVRRDCATSVEACNNSSNAVSVIKTQLPGQLAVAADYQRLCFSSLGQRDRTPVQTIQMLRLAARGIADLRFACFLQAEAADVGNDTALPVRQLQMRKRLAFTTALNGGTDPELACTG